MALAALWYPLRNSLFRRMHSRPSFFASRHMLRPEYAIARLEYRMWLVGSASIAYERAVRYTGAQRPMKHLLQCNT